MSFAAERKSIENRFKTEWTATPIAYDNVPFNPPANSDWVRLNIQNGDSGYRALEGSIRHTGIINVQIFTPVNKATKTSRQYADIVSSIFSDKRFDDIVTDVSSINIIDDDDAWLQTNITTPYYRDAEKIFVPVPVFEPLYVLLNSVKLEINPEDGNPEIIMQGDVDVITPSRLEISGVISGTFNYVVGIAVYVDGIAIGTGTRLNRCHNDCAFVVFHTGVGGDQYSFINPYVLVTDVLNYGIHKIEIGIIGKWSGTTHTIYVGDVVQSNDGIPSSSTLLVKEFGALNQGGGSIVVERDFSRLNSYLLTADPYTTNLLIANVPTKLLIPTLPKTIKDFSFDGANSRWFFDKPNATGKWFIVQLSTSLEISTNNKVVTIEMYKNGTPEEGVGGARFMATGSDKANLSLIGTTQLSHNDYIEIYVTLTGVGTITFNRLAITINEMVGAV